MTSVRSTVMVVVGIIVIVWCFRRSQGVIQVVVGIGLFVVVWLGVVGYRLLIFGILESYFSYVKRGHEIP